MSTLEVAAGGAVYKTAMRLGRRILGLRARIVTVEGVDIPVWTRDGRGDPLVLVHGFGADKEGWLGLIGKLRGRPIIALDLPGFGASSAIDPARATAVLQARAIKGVLDALEKMNVVLVGSSMGGGIALRFASDFPDVTAGVVLLGSVGPLVEKSQLQHALDQGKNPLIPSSRAEFMVMLDFVTAKKIWVPAPIAAYLASKQIARRQALDALFATWIAQDASDLDGVLAKITAPTLVIHGELDRVIDVTTARAIAARVPNATLMVLPGIGHVPQLEAPDRVARAIAAFVSPSH